MRSTRTTSYWRQPEVVWINLSSYAENMETTLWLWPADQWERRYFPGRHRHRGLGFELVDMGAPLAHWWETVTGEVPRLNIHS